MWWKTVLWVSCVLCSGLVEGFLEDNDIDSEDNLLQELASRTKKSPAIFDTVDKKIAARASESESDIKYVLAEDIKQRLESLKELNDAFEAVKVGIDASKREIKGSEEKSVSEETRNGNPGNKISPSSSTEIEDSSRNTRQLYPSSNIYATDRQFLIDKFGRDDSYSGTFDRSEPYGFGTGRYHEPIPSEVYDDKSDPYIARYNPDARTFGLAGVGGGFQANVNSGTEQGNKEGTSEGGGEKAGPVDASVIKQGGIQGGFIKGDHVHPGKGTGGLGGGLGGGVGGGLGGGAVHPIKQIKYLLPNFISAVTAAIGGASAGAAGAGLGGGGGGIGGIGGIGGGIGGVKHKHKLPVKPTVTVHKVAPHPIKLKPIETHYIPIKTQKKGKGDFFYSKNIIFGKIGGESFHKPFFPEGHYYNHPSYNSYPHGGQSGYAGYSYLSPFNFQYADRSPYYTSSYPADDQSSYGTGFAAYSQGNSFAEPAYLPYAQPQYYYPVDVKSFNDGSLPQLQLYQTPTTLNDPNYSNTNTNLNTDSYVRSHSHKSEESSHSQRNLEKIKADIEQEQKRIQELQEGLKIFADQLNSPDEGKIVKEEEKMNTGRKNSKEDMKVLNENP